MRRDRRSGVMAMAAVSVLSVDAAAQWLNCPTPGTPRLADGRPETDRLLARSQTDFMSTATATGFVFVRDARGAVTHLLVRGADGEVKAVRK